MASSHCLTVACSGAEAQQKAGYGHDGAVPVRHVEDTYLRGAFKDSEQRGVC